jgi:Mn-dependent DtxR family transcriptional regulator
MAEYLNVERSALSRELSKMKRDGLISYKKITLLFFDLFY